MHFAISSLALLALAVFPPARLPQDSNDTSTIESIVANLGDAWNRGDAKTFAAHFAKGGSFTNIVGMQTYGVEPFIKQHEHIFATIYKGSHLEIRVGTLMFIRPDVVVADVDCVVTRIASVPPGVSVGHDGALHTKLQLVLSKDLGTWTIDAFHNVPVSAAAQPSKE